MLIVQALLFSAVQCCLLIFCGLGLAMLVLPATLRDHEMTLAPAFGLAFLAIIGFYGTITGFTLRMILPVALLVSGGLLVSAMMTRKHKRLPGILPVGELLPLLGISMVCWLLCVAPALAFGRLMSFGYGLDVEFYMSLAAYLKEYSYPTLATAPAGPLRSLLLNQPIHLIAFGATYAQGIADLVGGWESWDSWMPFQATLRSVGLLALYALLRGALGVQRAGALLGVALTALSSLLLWLTYNNFSASLAALAVLPAALAVTLLALQEGGKRTIFGAGLLMGGLTCLYWPILTAFGALGLGLGLAALIARRDAPGAIVMRGVALLALGGIIGLVPNLRAPEAFPGMFEAEAPFMGIDFLVPPPILAGWLRFTHPEPIDPTGTEVGLGWLALVAGALLLGHGVWRGTTQRGATLGLALCALIYLLGLRFVVAYPYGYFRGASYMAPLLLGLAGAGIGATGAAVGQRRVVQVVGAMLALVVLVASSTASLGTTRTYASGPRGYSLATDDLRHLATDLVQPGPVFFSPAAATALCGTTQGAWAYWLRDRPLEGFVRGTFASSDNPRGAAMPAYAVLLHDENPLDHGFATQALWRDELVAVYPAPAERIAWLSGLKPYHVAPACPATVTNRFRASHGLGAYIAAAPEEPLEIYASAESLSLAPVSDLTPAKNNFELALVSLITQTIDLTIGNETQRLNLTPGLNIYQTGTISVPVRVVLQPAAEPVQMHWAALEKSKLKASSLKPARNRLILDVTTSTSPLETEAEIDLRIRNQSTQQLRLAIEIYEEVTGYRGTPGHYAGTTMTLPDDGDYQLRLDLQTPAADLDGTDIDLQAIDLRDGQYFASLWVYQGEQIRRFIPLVAFARRNGLVEDIEPLSANTVAVTIDPPAQTLEATFGALASLEGYELSEERLRGGDNLRLSLLWRAEAPATQPYLVFVQLLDANEQKIAQWDGLAGGDWRPISVWQPGERLWQDIPLTIAPDAPPGRYRVVIGLYDPGTGERLALDNNGDMLTLTEVEVSDVSARPQ
ncbi:hypothetical protein [Candidatus Chloroploca asiatica]|uniref:Glycosyltransferase RgtA/B/C/D-like domain-containing protein n=1 Tax=Candidatus Chloroploca asiatica TaxID=1506545 RepID=A0A2H3KGX2_9CHLR|nr:hypothetical protein [Candidatus Chloroploca asiatica]PDV96979.1 hypothetical protein A9Q02_05420 [Candidatus Chloroploca asiatica]